MNNSKKIYEENIHVVDLIRSIIDSNHMNIFRRYMDTMNIEEKRDITRPSLMGSPPSLNVIPPTSASSASTKSLSSSVQPTSRPYPLIWKLYKLFFNACGSTTTTPKLAPSVEEEEDEVGPSLDLTEDTPMSFYDFCEHLPVLQLPANPIPYTLTREPSSSTSDFIETVKKMDRSDSLSVLHSIPNPSDPLYHRHLEYVADHKAKEHKILYPTIGNQHLCKEFIGSPLKFKRPLDVTPLRARLFPSSKTTTTISYSDEQPSEDRKILILYICSHGGLIPMPSNPSTHYKITETYPIRNDITDVNDPSITAFSNFINENFLMWPYCPIGLLGQDIIDTNMLFDLNVIDKVMHSTHITNRNRLDVLLQTLIYLNGPTIIPGRGSMYNTPIGLEDQNNWWALLYRSERGIPIKMNLDVRYGGSILYNKEKKDLREEARKIETATTPNPSGTLYKNVVKKYDRRIGILYTDIPTDKTFKDFNKIIDGLNSEMSIEGSNNVYLSDILTEVFNAYPEVQVNIIDFSCKGSTYEIENSQLNMSAYIDAAINQIRETCRPIIHKIA